MSKPVRTFPDAEIATKDLLKALIAPHEPTVTVGIAVPDNWTTESPDHLQVSLEGPTDVERAITSSSTVRITAWSASTSRAKELVSLAFGLLCAHAGGDGIAVIVPLTGPLPARDPDNRGELAYVTVRVTVRSIPV